MKNSKLFKKGLDGVRLHVHTIHGYVTDFAVGVGMEAFAAPSNTRFVHPRQMLHHIRNSVALLEACIKELEEGGEE